MYNGLNIYGMSYYIRTLLVQDMNKLNKREGNKEKRLYCLVLSSTHRQNYYFIDSL